MRSFSIACLVMVIFFIGTLVYMSEQDKTDFENCIDGCPIRLDSPDLKDCLIGCQENFGCSKDNSSEVEV